MIALVLLLMGCPPPLVDDPPLDAAIHPHLMATPADREPLLARLEDPLWDDIHTRMVEIADREYRAETGDGWDYHAHATNGDTARSAAFLAWLHEDELMAQKAISFLDQFPSDFETNTVWDVNIRMPHPLIGYTDTVDFLLATPWYSADQSLSHAEKITDVTDKFYEGYIEDAATRGLLLGTTQNNHPIRTATAIGYVALAFPEHSDAEKWLDWSVSELDYLWGPTGQYVQPDGGVSEGPFYYGFALSPSIAFMAALENAAPGRTFHRDCANRSDQDPWAGHGCVDGEEFTFGDRLTDPAFQRTVEWWISIRLPSGNCPPLGDAYFNHLNGPAILTGFGAPSWFTWSWANNSNRPYTTTHGMDLTPLHLLYVSDDVGTEPPFTTRFLPEAGNAVFRSDWSEDAIWGLLMAESGSARKTVHDHVDGTSFSMAAYGEYLLIDPGYYKPDEASNARTANSPAHNLVLIDGRAAPNKGLLTNFGDTDAHLRNTLDTGILDWAEAHQSYQDTDVVRGVAFVRNRYFLLADLLETTHTTPREHAWRLSGYAGYGSGGVFTLHDDGATWERELAGVRAYIASPEDLTVVEPDRDPDQPPHVHQFELDRSVSDHAVIDAITTSMAPDFLTVLAPYKMDAVAGEEALTVVEEDVGEGAVAWTITGVWGSDHALLRTDSAVESYVIDGVAVETDADVVWWSEEEALVVRGTYLSVGGEMRVSGNAEDVVVVE